MPPKVPLKKENALSDDEFDRASTFDKGFWEAAASIPHETFTTPREKTLHSRTGSGGSSSKGRMHGPDLGHNPTTRGILSRSPSMPVVVSESVEARVDISKPVSSTNQAGRYLGSLPTTPKRRQPLADPPSTGRTRAIAQAFRSLTVQSPTKKEWVSQPSLRTHATPTSQPRQTTFIEVHSDDEEEGEVNDMLIETDSSPPTRPASLFDYDASQRSGSMITPASSWTLGDRSGQSSLSSLDHELSANVAAKRKRVRSSDASDIEVRRIEISSPDKPAPSADVFATPRIQQGQQKTKDVQCRKPVVPTPSVAAALSSSAPSGVSKFFRDTLGVNLNPIIIEHSGRVQEVMDKHDIAWGVQYEFARGVSGGYWTWDDVYRVLQKKLNEFKGSNADVAYKVGPILRGNEVRDANHAIWQELDREQAAIVEGKGRGLGLMGRWYDQDDWHGGCIQQLARLSKNDTGYRVKLEPMEKRRSHRFARYCGSRRILQLRIPKELILEENERLKKFLKGKFILCGRIFIPFHAKDHSLYMVETNENWERKERKECGDHYRLSFADFINWHNPPEYNHTQALSKYVTRFALGLSTSIPVLEFEAKNIYFIDDIYGSDYKGGKGRKPSAEETMTDGCGFINQTALIAINEKLNKQSLPVAVQGRIAGAKGLWLLHPSDESSEFKIWIRDSQNKIKFPALDRSHRILELVATSQPSNPVSISKQSIVNLSFNGVPDRVLTEYLEKGLVEAITPLVDWSRPKAHLYLWHAINNAGGISRARLARVTAGISRALGLTRRQWAEAETDATNDGDAFDEANTAYTGRNEYSKAPLSLNETALELVQAGFHPSHSKILRDKLEVIIDQEIKSCIEKYRIPLSESLDGFVVPDPLGILEEGEIYYRSSQSLLNPRTQRTFDILTGDVVLGRYPIRVASDLQKVKAVNLPELYQWPDVIIASTRGSRSLASLLSGGDMDGDELFILREPEIVEPFQNRPLVPQPTDLLEANFRKDIEIVSQFCERVRTKSSSLRQEEFQGALLLSLNEDRKGLYSMFHDNAVEKFGYDHPEAIRLAYMFNTLLDSSKSGLVLRDGIFEADQKKFRSGQSIEDKYFDGTLTLARRPTPPQDPASASFILNKLEKAGKEKGEELKKMYASAVEQTSNQPDPDLVAPYNKAFEFAIGLYERKGLRYFDDDLRKIRNHVDKAHEMWKLGIVGKKSKSAKPPPSSSAAEDINLCAWEFFASEVKDIIATPNVDDIKASYAYVASPDSSFPFGIAFGKLCEIKCKATRGGLAPCIREIDEMKTISGSHVRAVEKSYND